MDGFHAMPHTILSNKMLQIDTVEAEASICQGQILHSLLINPKSHLLPLQGNFG